MLSLLLITAAVCGISVVLGSALANLVGAQLWAPLAPVVGFALLMVLVTGAIRLPGHAVTARVVVVLAVLAGLFVIRRGGTSLRVGPEWLGAGLLALGLASLPFLVAGRVGTLAVLDNADFSGHLVLAHVLKTGASASTAIYGTGYPVGPHAVATTFGVLGADVKGSFNAMLVGVPVLTALTALAALSELSRGRRVLGAAVVALPYLAAAYLTQASFKEPMQALFVLGFAVGLATLARTSRPSLSAAAPLGLLAAACLFTYGYAGLAWPVGITGVWLVAELAMKRRLPTLSAVRSVAGYVAVAGVTLVVASASDAGRMFSFIQNTTGVETGATTGGNIGQQIPGYEVLGLWLSRDFRGSPNAFYAGMLGGVALAAIAYGFYWWIRRRELTVPAAVLTCLALYAVARNETTPYYETKAMVIAAPLVMLLGVRALLAAVPSWTRIRRWRSLDTEGRLGLAVATVFIVAALASTVGTLTNARVGPSEHESELAGFREQVKGQPTLFLAQDDYAFWELRGALVGTTISYVGKSDVTFSLRPTKPFAEGTPVDFDSLDRGNLDRFRYAVAPRSSYASVPPPNWRVVRRTTSYALWERRGTTPNREILNEGGGPGAMFNCRSAARRRLSQREGEAGVLAKPVTGSPSAWTVESGVQGGGRFSFLSLTTGGTATQRLKLAPGEWELSLQYVSPTKVEVKGRGLDTRLPASEERPGPYWPVGRVTGGKRPVRVAAHVESTLPGAGGRTALLGTLAATRVGGGEVVPLKEACGRYVDWYVLHDQFL